MREVNIVEIGRDPYYVIVDIRGRKYKYTVNSEYAVRKFVKRLRSVHLSGGEGYRALNWFRKRFKPKECRL